MLAASSSMASLSDSPPEVVPASHSVLPASGSVGSVTMESAPPTGSGSRGSLAQSPDGAVVPAACGCATCSGSGGPQLVYALGQLGCDFGTEARRDAFIQAMEAPAAGVTPNPFDSRQLLNHLEKNPWDAAALNWTLNLDGTTVYALSGEGPFAEQVYLRLRQFLGHQIDPEGSERISMPGRLSGKVRLMNGQVVPVIVPDLRGMYSWTTQGLVHAVVGAPLAASASTAEKEERAKKQQALREFLDRVYLDSATFCHG